MDALIYAAAMALVKVIQALPLRWVARLGRFGGEIAYWVDARHRRVARSNLTMVFGAEKSRRAIRALVRENFRRIGENFCCAAKTAAMSTEALQPHLEMAGDGKLYPEGTRGDMPRRIVALGHFGNFELYARLGQRMPGVRTATTYRALPNAALDRVLQKLRSATGCLYFERRKDQTALKNAMLLPGIVLGILADQHAGDRALRVPFFGKECFTSAAPALFALRYACPLYTAVCYRIGLAQWRVEFGDVIATHQDGHVRPIADIMLDVNRAFETAIRRDPANWFWVHRRWKAGVLNRRRPAPKARKVRLETMPSQPSNPG